MGQTIYINTLNNSHTTAYPTRPARSGGGCCSSRPKADASSQRRDGTRVKPATLIVELAEQLDHLQLEVEFLHSKLAAEREASIFATVRRTVRAC